MSEVGLKATSVAGFKVSRVALLVDLLVQLSRVHSVSGRKFPRSTFGKAIPALVFGTVSSWLIQH
jgi:hypothetical protein